MNKMCVCNPQCIYFPNEVYETTGKESMYVDENGTKHWYAIPKMCRYDWHSIEDWKECSHFKNVYEAKGLNQRHKVESNSFPLLVICGESAAGKDTILKCLKSFGFEDIVSYTTRPIRDGEQQDKEYHFISKEKFLEMMGDDKFAETRSYNTLFNGIKDTWYYGLAKEDLAVDNKRKLCIVDPLGAKEIIDKVGEHNCICVYIETEEDIRKERAIKRGSFSEEEWDRRQIDDKTRFTKQFFVNYVDLCINNDKDFSETEKQLYQLYFEYYQ